MPAETQPVELGTVMAELGSKARLVTSSVAVLARSVRGASVWVSGDPVPKDPTLVVVCAGIRHDALSDLAPLLKSKGSLLVAVCFTSEGAKALPPDRVDEGLGKVGKHVVLTVSANPGEVVSAVARATQSAEEAVSARLGSLQRSLSLALAEPSPIPALLERLKRVCNATAVLIDRRGEVVHATGPVPRSLLFEQISSTTASTQSLSVDGWHGLATRVADPESPEEHTGWLLVASRRVNFPDAHASSAVHVAGSLVEASQRMGVVVRQQERAVRAAVLEQALAMRLERQDAELAARVAGLGIDFEQETRVVVSAFATTLRAGSRQQAAETLLEQFGQLLAAAGYPALLTARADGVTMLVQCSVGSVQRMIARAQDRLPGLLVGIGRATGSVDSVVDSYHDAQLAVRTMRRVSRQQSVMAYEDFDFATRLFSDVGMDRMVAWAEDFLKPLSERDNLLVGLEAYFEYDQNINLAADALSIHHNSLRYRLGKVEELLTINLKQPASISSLFLALTAIDLTRQHGALRPKVRVATETRVTHDSDIAAIPTSFVDSDRAGIGVVRGSD